MTGAWPAWSERHSIRIYRTRIQKTSNPYRAYGARWRDAVCTSTMKHGEQRQRVSTFRGFEVPTSNFFRMPNDWTDVTADISNLAELKVVEYILRHTWGYHEYGSMKHLTVDEFASGRKRSDGTRMDKGTGLSERGVRYGLASAIEHGYVDEEIDESDRGRVKKYYRLRMQDGELAGQTEGVQPMPAGMQDLPARGAQFAPRSEKATQDRHFNVRNSRMGISQDSSSSRTAVVDSSTSIEPRSRGGGLASVRTLLAARGAPIRLESSTAASSTDRTSVRPSDAIEGCIADISVQLGDGRHLASNITHARRLHRVSNIDISSFTNKMYEAHAITKDRLRDGGIGKPMAFYFAVAHDVLGLRKAVGESDHQAEIRGSQQAA